MRFAPGDVRDHIILAKSTTDLRTGATVRCSGGKVPKETSQIPSLDYYKCYSFGPKVGPHRGWGSL